MTQNETSTVKLINKLQQAGHYPQPDLIDIIWERRDETEPLLLALFAEAYDDDWTSDTDPRWQRFTHAGAFMIAWKNLDALPIFARLYGDDAKQDWLEAFEEDLFYYGPVAIPYLQQVVAKESGGQWHYGRGLCGSTLTKIATYYPETRKEIAAIFQALLPLPDAIPPEHDEMWGNWAEELGELADETSRDHILALDDVGVLSPEYFGRQNYLRNMNRGFKPQNSPPPYDIREDYQKQYSWEQDRQKRMAKEREQQRASRIRPAQPRTEPKIGRNAPCPCGSGKKYKKCHGRPGA